MYYVLGIIITVPNPLQDLLYLYLCLEIFWKCHQRAFFSR